MASFRTLATDTCWLELNKVANPTVRSTEFTISPGVARALDKLGLEYKSGTYFDDLPLGSSYVSTVSIPPAATTGIPT